MHQSMGNCFGKDYTVVTIDSFDHAQPLKAATVNEYGFEHLQPPTLALRYAYWVFETHEREHFNPWPNIENANII